MSFSEVLTILVAFHQQSYRTFKDFYLKHVSVYWCEAFPTLVSDTRFVAWMLSTIIPLCVYLRRQFG